MNVQVPLCARKHCIPKYGENWDTASNRDTGVHVNALADLLTSGCRFLFFSSSNDLTVIPRQRQIKRLTARRQIFADSPSEEGKRSHLQADKNIKS